MASITETGIELWETFLKTCGDKNIDVSSLLKIEDQGQYVFSISYFIAQFAQRFPEAFTFLITSNRMHEQKSDYHKLYQIELENVLQSVPDEVTYNTWIRTYRQRESVRIAWQHLTLQNTFERLALDISSLAKNLISYTHDYHYHKLLNECAYSPDSTPPKMLILCMGKLGADELNFSSDIDLIFIHEKDDKYKTISGRTILALQFYTKLGQRIINSLHQIQANGFVYRVDMRLRPFGDSGPLSMSLKAFDDYCHKHGRDWERYAMIKATCIAGSPEANQQLNDIIHDFTYRPYQDFMMGEAIRKMKHKIMKEKKKLDANIKLGRGGIREAEFITQSYQLIYGGQNARIAVPSIKQALTALSESKILDKSIANEIYDCYVLLRNVENSLQILREQQTHSLPEDAEDRLRIARSLNYETWSELDDVIEKAREKVQNHFDLLTSFSTEIDVEHCKSSDTPKAPVDESSLSHNQSISTDLSSSYLLKFETWLSKKELDEELRTIILLLFTKVQNELQKHPHWNHEKVYEHVIRFFKKIIKRPTYVYMLHERQRTLINWLQLLEMGSYFAQMIEQHPFLLERTLRPREKNQIYLQSHTYLKKLNDYLDETAPKDKEERLESIRRFKLTQIFNIAVAKSLGKITLMESSDIMSSLAEGITQKILSNAWSDLIEKEDIPSKYHTQLQNSLAIIAYGKLGGLELGFSSDLDIIFLYKEPQGLPFVNKTLFTKVSQKFVSLMQAHTYSGKLYEIDLRLRPEGNSGLLVSTVEAFQNYQQNSAWLWEHQALVRARWIAGGEQIKAEFESIRISILQKHHNDQKLKSEIITMRDKMRQELLKTNRFFDLKQSSGGMVDIEFLAQYFALKYSNQYPQISFFTDNIRIFESMETVGLLGQSETASLVNTYCYYRDLNYHSFFNQEDTLILFEQVSGYPEKIMSLWQKYLGPVDPNAVKIIGVQ